MLARRVDGEERIAAGPGLVGVCPGCCSELTAKCGEIRVWHWSHRAANDCDPWHESETDWHLWWKSKAPRDWIEVSLGPHRADVRRDDGLVLEFQHSHIDPATIREREGFYGLMAWLVDLRDVQHHLDFREAGEGIRFHWRHARKVWAKASKPLFFDLGDRVLEVLSLTQDASTGTGRLMSVPAFLSWARLAQMTARERATPVRYHVTRSNERTMYLRRPDFGGAMASSVHQSRAEALEAARSTPSIASWTPLPVIDFEGHQWRTDRHVPDRLRSFDHHAVDVTVVARSGRRRTLRRDLVKLVRRADELGLRYPFGDPLPLYRRVVRRVFARIETATGPKCALPILRAAMIDEASGPRCPPPPPTRPTAPRCKTIRTACGDRRALPLHVTRDTPAVVPVCPPPKPPRDRDPERDRDGRWGRIVPQPTNNGYGPLLVLRRTDDLFVVIDPNAPLVTRWPVFKVEADARTWARARAPQRTGGAR
jgi:hypothetical protein